MTTAVLAATDLAVVENVKTNQIATTSTEAVVADNLATVFVTLQDVGNVLVETPTSQVVVHGIMGPPGRDGIAEEDMVYSKRVDFVGETTIYRGEAAVGSSESSLAWRIRRISIGADGDVTETWAGGTALFDKSWAERFSYTYS